MQKTINIKKYYLIIFFISIISLLFAIYIEYLLNQKPCKLCLYQRIPYLISIFICFFGFNYHKNLFWAYILIFVFILSSVISGYHVGIENDIFKEFSGCTSENLQIIDKTKLLESLKNMPSCKDVNFRLFGFSLANINFIISLIITISSISILKNEKNK